MKAITVKELSEKAAKLVKAGYGEKKILVTNDDECNGVHELFGLFSRISEDYVPPLPCGVSEKDVIDNYIILG